MKYEWFCTDSECMQYGRKISETEYEFIKAVWLNACGDDERVKNSKK